MSEITDFLNKAYIKLNSSQLLFDNGDYSNAVSLVYYSMFLTAKALLLLKDIHPKKHRGTLDQFYLNYVETGEFSREAYSLASSQSLRESSDYSAVDDIDKDVAEEKIELANLFMEEAERILEEFDKDD